MVKASVIEVVPLTGAISMYWDIEPCDSALFVELLLIWAGIGTATVSQSAFH